jgi:hypothetical protein
MGADYGVATVAWVLVTGVAVLAAHLSTLLVGAIPIVGGIPARMLWIWAQFVGSHLLGWAVYRHSVELGWD